MALLIRRFPELVGAQAPAGHGPPHGRADDGSPDRAAALGPLYLSDTVRDITDGVVELEEAVRERLGLRPVGPAPVPVRLRRIAGLLERIAADPLLAAHVEDETRRMADRCAHALDGSGALGA
ncbi:hypothetical protein GCM10010358_30630 [Streptomyces minutiscleroticus]|uniref:Uncharacterized protein n=2 Tax=Streptomyces minutiscleroticus TaxID=68238 RepID=A0A918KSA5_9ACTN|nr:hypothetical protein GCM10010358_30630 [Streptomyces minutiscleroticus]